VFGFEWTIFEKLILKRFRRYRSNSSKQTNKCPAIECFVKIKTRGTATIKLQILTLGFLIKLEELFGFFKIGPISEVQSVGLCLVLFRVEIYDIIVIIIHLTKKAILF
jgi:hypothetical protein